MVMPGMGGAELAQAALPLRPGMKILFMSGYTESAAVHRGPAGERMPFLQKPFTAHELGERVREALAVAHEEGTPGDLAVPRSGAVARGS
jgi:two-component system cell cycle sensor histidine kinase/response regulator CckA